MDVPEVSRLLDFTGRVALVTGAGSGLGGAVALRFAEAGARVAVHYRSSRAGATALAERIGAGRAIAIGGDLAKEPDARALVARTVEAFGRLDVLVNNAGAYPMAGVLEMTAAQWDEVIAANLTSVYLGTQAAARQMVAQGGGGAIVNITSIEADTPAPAHSHYNAAKAGAAMYTRAAAQELGPHGIRVNAVAPGLIWREGLEEAWPDGVARFLEAAPLGRLGQPGDVADACLFLASPAARWITGASLTVDGGVLVRKPF
ncbi:MAG: SDR family NAD(P)-dependent oxidoreductase [Solirubrobacterales bacterium]|jgi:NAD(P)-dependent dehydrogenase (short-subunit alcohol dehydrogenase family)